ERRARRADADHPSGEHLDGARERGLRGDGLERASPGSRERRTHACSPVHVTVAEAPAVADEVAVHVAVVAVDDAAQTAVALLRRDVAADAAVRADRRRGLQVPFADVVIGERLVGEDARRTDLREVAAPLALEHAVLVPAE